MSKPDDRDDSWDDEWDDADSNAYQERLEWLEDQIRRTDGPGL